MFWQKIKGFMVAHLLLSLFMLSGCVSPVNQQQNNNGDKPTNDTYKSTIDFLDVGSGECAVIKLPDGKSMLIDCGRDDKVYPKISNLLEERNIDKIDYFILTHPDAEHVGNACQILNDYKVDLLYHSKIIKGQTALFEQLYDAVDLAKQKGVATKESLLFNKILGDGYFFLFLSPNPDYHLDVGAQEVPTSESVDDFSPIIYAEILGTTFVFTGDAGDYSEQKFLETYHSGMFDYLLSSYDKTLRIERVDFLKVAKSGGYGACSGEFIGLLCPNHAVLSVGGDSYTAIPSTFIVQRIINSNKNCKILRTDLDGTISVKIKNQGEFIIRTEAN